MPLFFVQNDITKMQVDAIVNAANPTLLGGGGVDGCIHRAAGPELLTECRTLGGCPTGEAKITGGYALPSKYVIHTVGPVWRGGGSSEEETLTSCYTRSLTLAKAYGCQSVAFPLISSGVYGYPKGKALAVATQAIVRFLQTGEMTVYLVIFDRLTLTAGEQRFGELNQYLLRHSPQEGSPRGRLWGRRSLEEPQREECAAPISAARAMGTAGAAPARKRQDTCARETDRAAVPALEEMLRELDESFSQMLLRLIDARGLTDAQCYKKANIDRKLFSKIRSDPHYRPSKPTVLAFAIALELNLEQTRALLLTAGFALSHSSKFDLIVEYFILRKNYDIHEINMALFAYDQRLLGA